MKQHLSPEQIDGWIIGERTAEVEDHLQSCSACADEVARVAGPLTLFGSAVRSWGEERMGPMRVSRMAASAPVGWWRLGLAFAAILLFIAVPVLRHRAAVIAAHTEAQTAAQDERLLRQVEQEISQSVPAPMEPLAKLMPNDFTR